MAEKRTFTDREGVRWTVTEVAPQQDISPARDRRQLPRMAKRAAATNARFDTRDLLLASLRFDSRTDSRIVTPAPVEWRTFSDAVLEDLLGRSKRLPGR